MSAARRYSISTEQERFWLAAEVARHGKAAGLGPSRQGALRIVVAELVSNAIRHGGGAADVHARCLEQAGCCGLEVVVEDQGPGIASIESALRDGFSEGRELTPETPPALRRSLGVGLGAVARLTDELHIEPRQPAGTRIRVVFLERRPKGRP